MNQEAELVSNEKSMSQHDVLSIFGTYFDETKRRPDESHGLN